MVGGRMKNIFVGTVFFILTVVLFSSCVTSKDTNLLQDIKKDYSTVPPPDEYRIIPGDLLQIVVYIWDADDSETARLFRGYMPSFVSARENEMAGVGGRNQDEGTRNVAPIPVFADGTINFPYLGRIYVADLTLLEARQLITNRIQELSANSSVNVTLRNNFFSILGDSGARRVEMRSNNMTIYQALSTAGNLSDYSKRNSVTILRQVNGGTQVKTFDLRSKDIVNTEFYYIQPNDVIYFPQGKAKFFGATNSFLGFFGLITSFTSILVMAFKIF